ncbi:hypothetical protein DKX38_004774 [Salix brachista]|uniref:Uncharacterized protein n=1 Tax=Salix brachista TaxID=2182728 RepID=A0A5N5NAS1_9ROSI|nr:hypothetical protein DKX38_004774 [Salix brachista]
MEMMLAASSTTRPLFQEPDSVYLFQISGSGTMNSMAFSVGNYNLEATKAPTIEFSSHYQENVFQQPRLTAEEEAPCELTAAPSGLAFSEKIVGAGPEAVNGQLIKFFICLPGYNRGKPLTFPAGVGEFNLLLQDVMFFCAIFSFFKDINYSQVDVDIVCKSDCIVLCSQTEELTVVLDDEFPKQLRTPLHDINSSSKAGTKLSRGERKMKLPPELGYGVKKRILTGHITAGSCIIPPDSVLLLLFFFM